MLLLFLLLLLFFFFFFFFFFFIWNLQLDWWIRGWFGCCCVVVVFVVGKHGCKSILSYFFWRLNFTGIHVSILLLNDARAIQMQNVEAEARLGHVLATTNGSWIPCNTSKLVASSHILQVSAHTRTKPIIVYSQLPEAVSWQSDFFRDCGCWQSNFFRDCWDRCGCASLLSWTF